MIPSQPLPYVLPKISYFDEISQMMYGYGDAHNRNPDTVRLVESIVLTQLRTIIREGSKYAEGKEMTGRELVFLMRRSPNKMRNFVKYLKSSRSSKEATEGSNKPTDSNRSMLLEFIESIDETGEFRVVEGELDDIKLSRLKRADKISIFLDQKGYLEYEQARCSSFRSKGLEKFKLWVYPGKELEFKEAALEVLMYYAQETVAQLVDYCFLVRGDTMRGPDPFSSSKEYFSKKAFTVAEVKEVMRRVSSPQAGKLILGKKLPDTHYVLVL